MENSIKELLLSTNLDDIALGLEILKASGYNNFEEISLFYSENYPVEGNLDYANVWILYFRYLDRKDRNSFQTEDKKIFEYWKEN